MSKIDAAIEALDRCAECLAPHNLPASDEARSAAAALRSEVARASIFGTESWRKSVWYPLTKLLADNGYIEGGATYVAMLERIVSERDSARAERDEADTLLEEARTIIGAIPYVDPISVMEWRQIHSTLGKIDAHLAKKGAQK